MEQCIGAQSRQVEIQLRFLGQSKNAGRIKILASQEMGLACNCSDLIRKSALAVQRGNNVKRKFKFSQTFQNVLVETQQQPSQRKPVLQELQKLLEGRTVVSFFISFSKAVPLSSQDADILEEVLVNSDNKKGVTLLLDAPGGDGLTAERIIKICRAYSGGDFEVIVPARAKSAATMVCLGADKILMSNSSELGPIDPQVVWDLGNGPTWFAAHHIIKTYDGLFQQALQMNNGNIDPILQQLSKFNAVMVESLRSASKLAEDIAVSSLMGAMMKDKTPEEIRDKIKSFTNPELTMSHGRGIYAEKAIECGLNVKVIDTESELWAAVRSLYIRSSHVVTATQTSKIVETPDFSYASL